MIPVSEGLTSSARHPSAQGCSQAVPHTSPGGKGKRIFSPFISVPFFPAPDRTLSPWKHFNLSTAFIQQGGEGGWVGSADTTTTIPWLAANPEREARSKGQSNPKCHKGSGTGGLPRCLQLPAAACAASAQQDARQPLSDLYPPARASNFIHTETLFTSEGGGEEGGILGQEYTAGCISV